MKVVKYIVGVLFIIGGIGSIVKGEAFVLGY